MKSDENVGFVLWDVEALPSITFRLIEDCEGLSQIFVDGNIRLLEVDRARFGKTCIVDPETIRPVIEKLDPAETLAGSGINLQPNGSARLRLPAETFRGRA